MNSLKNKISAKPRFAAACVCLVLLFLTGTELPAQTPTPSASATPTATPSVTPTATPRSTATPTPTATATVTPTPIPANADELARFRAMEEEGRRKGLVSTYWYFILVTLMFAAVLFPFVSAIFRGTSGSLVARNRPLGLPIGSFRAILAYSLVTYLGFYVLTSILSISLFAPPEFLLGIVATVVGFYFGSRSGAEEETDAKTGVVRGTVRQASNPARGALIKFKRSDDGTEPYSRISDINGRFELRGAKPGRYRISASLTGSPPSDEQEIAVTEGSDHEIEIAFRSAAGQAPQNGTVQGTVTDPNGTPVNGAKVALLQGNAEKFTKTTDAAGKYKIDAVPAGEYEAQASLTPHTPSDKMKVTVAAGVPQTADLKLK